MSYKYKHKKATEYTAQENIFSKFCITIEMQELRRWQKQVIETSKLLRLQKINVSLQFFQFPHSLNDSLRAQEQVCYRIEVFCSTDFIAMSKQLHPKQHFHKRRNV